jgi:hypothetical protein
LFFLLKFEQAQLDRFGFYSRNSHFAVLLNLGMKKYGRTIFSVLAAIICASAFAADQPSCKTTGKNCPMNNGKACNCGKSCDC